ncbi:MAG: glutamate--tRNA ligase, partial [Jannaschia sp.]
FVRDAVAMLPDPPFTPETWGTWTAAVKEASGRKGAALFKPLRLAMTGTTSGPEMAALMPLLQKKPVI